ncbi:Alpha/Beta hydrolase protein [Kockovaella imperatae]|uniref:Alpha/Beta hydrolase protein n=1 Tax=Kockovaella imperatae TaxID=4999 RepID=A0A1Y1UDY7_9TREE|nr:Alpha/Beta hydrolase protein [Kockovaella imperatae]ORX35734.1 Alpha/Beta hydrolase protein [Kockovaella imperatae]
MAIASSSSNPFAHLISQEIAVIPIFTLESGVEVRDVPVAYKTWGKLNAARDNCLVICHALTGSADVEDWWGPLLGPDKAFDPTRFFIFCANVIGSPYGTISSVTTNPETGLPFGPEMPGSSVKDDVRLHYTILKRLGVRSVAAVIGGSMGGMTCLEYPLNTPSGFVRAIIPLATSARHSAWCISWGEAQRQSIYSDPDYRDGYYFRDEAGNIDLRNQPGRGLAAARMAALLTYRSRDSFESRFGRRSGGGSSSKVPRGGVRIMGGAETTNPAEPSQSDLERSASERAWREHNDGHRSSVSGSAGSTSGKLQSNSSRSSEAKLGAGAERTKIFSAQSYLRYQGDKFTGRFDANCYIHITRKLDTHDLSQPSKFSAGNSLSASLTPVDNGDESAQTESLIHALSLLPPALVIGIESDGLFTTSEQRELAAHIPDAELVVIPSPDGHDGFLIEFEAINGWIDGWLRRKVPEFYTERARMMSPEEYAQGAGDLHDGFNVKKESVFGEAEADVTAW